MCVGRETFIPKRMLFGIVPDCILFEYRFWQDESKYNWKSSEPLLEQFTFVQQLLFRNGPLLGFA